MKALAVITTLGIGIWLSATWVLAFFFLMGNYIYEPSKLIASIELAVATIVTAWFIFQLINYVRQK